ncbi:MAG TPA: hypothetical protein VHC92_07745 [Rhodanobacteraceae bacterium]|jgi:hypothetical protein|nr:hypothetical protein [Rhodanobacteraceae bacterium]
MNSTNLSNLYVRLTRANDTAALDADDLVAAADGKLASDRREPVAVALAGSAAHAKLAHVLRDLAADSDTLALDVARVQRGTAHRHPQRTERRVGNARRFAAGMRWAAGMAACLVAVVGFWTLRHAELHSATTPTQAHGPALVRADVIFSTRDTISNFGMDGPAAQAKTQSDRLFRSNFAGG